MGPMRRWLAMIVAAPWLVAAALAQDVLPVPPLSARVIDQTATLGAAQQQALEAKLAALEASHGSQLVVLIVPSTLPEDIAAYAQRVGDTWKIGRRDVGDGALIVVAKNDRRVRIEVAKALEGAIPDLAARRIIDEQIRPAFRAGDYAGGLNLAIDQLGARIRGEALPEPAQRSGEPARGLDLQDLAIFMFVGVPVVGAVLTGVFGRKIGSLLTGGAAGGVGWWMTTSALIGGAAGLIALLLVGVMGVGASRGGHASGGPIIWGGGGGGWGSGDGGGGFGSGGGGDFGGGGASGDW
jgi:uncharacterized protein